MISRLNFTLYRSTPSQTFGIWCSLDRRVNTTTNTKDVVLTNFTGFTPSAGRLSVTQFAVSDGGTLGSSHVDLSPITATFRHYGDVQASRRKLSDTFVIGARINIFAVEAYNALSPYWNRPGIVTAVDTQVFSNTVETVVTIYPETSFWYIGASPLSITQSGNEYGGTSNSVSTSFVLPNDISMAPCFLISTDTALTRLTVSGPNSASWSLPFNTAGLPSSYNNTMPANSRLSCDMNRETYFLGWANGAVGGYSSSGSITKHFPPPPSTFELPPGTHSFRFTASPTTAKIYAQLFYRNRRRML